MTVYKNIYFVPSFLYIPHFTFWYMRVCVCLCLFVWVWFLMSERSHAIIVFFNISLLSSLQRYTHENFVSSFAHIHIHKQYQKTAYLIYFPFLSYKLTHFPAGRCLGTTCWRFVNKNNRIDRTNETYMLYECP